jgi:putative membrane protein
MKLINKFTCRLFILAVVSSLPVFVAYGQEDATTGDDAHPAVDSPYLRRKPKPAASAAAQTKLSQKDQTFLSKIAAGGVQEVQDAQVAQKQGNDSVKNIASRIASERSRNNSELLALTKKKGLGLGTDKIKPRSMGKSNFDKQYLYTTTQDIKEDIRLVQAAAKSADDKDVKAWANRTLPMLQQQLSMVNQASGKGKG